MSDSTTPESDDPQESREVAASEQAAQGTASSSPDQSADQPDSGQGEHSITEFRAAAFQGPLPPPQILQAYENIEPGFANRIVTMAEDQSDHRRGLERSVVDGNLSAQERGQRYALILGLAGAALAGLLIWKDQFWWGVGLFMVELLSLAALFIVGRKRGVQELKEKQEREESPPGSEQQELQLETPQNSDG